MRCTLMLVLAAFALVTPRASAEERTLFAFDEENLGRVWTTVNDGVMGGRSSGGPEFSGGVLTFRGTIVTDGGGFSSIRTRERDWGFEAGGGVILRVQGDGRRYHFDVRTGDRLGRRTIAYRAAFVAPEGDGWLDIRLPFDEFVPTVWGTDVTGRVPELDPARVRSVGLNLSDGVDGRFELRVDEIRSYAAADLPEADEVADAPAALPLIETHTLPDEWLGLWSGTSTAHLRDGRTLEFATALEVRPKAGEPGVWSWTLVYGEGDQRQVRAYELLAVPDMPGVPGVPGGPGRFRIDEQNGIVLEQLLVGTAMYGRFVVGGSDIAGVYRLAEDGASMELELVTYAAPPDGVETGGEGNVPAVYTAVPVAVQRGRLAKVDNVK